MRATMPFTSKILASAATAESYVFRSSAFPLKLPTGTRKGSNRPLDKHPGHEEHPHCHLGLKFPPLSVITKTYSHPGTALWVSPHQRNRRINSVTEAPAQKMGVK